mgnify:CR=1 FL=1
MALLGSGMAYLGVCVFYAASLALWSMVLACQLAAVYYAHSHMAAMLAAVAGAAVLTLLHHGLSSGNRTVVLGGKVAN